MNTFGLITKIIMNIDETKSFLSPYYEQQTHNKCWLLQIILSNFLLTKITTRYKFQLFFDTLNGPFIGGREEDFINDFCKIQKTYHVLNRFIWNYKYKKSVIVVDTDMCLNNLKITDKNVLCIFQ